MDHQELEQAEKHIKNAWVAGAVSAAITFILSLIGAYNDDFRYTYGFDTWSLLDVALVAGLTYGIYRKKRFAALGMLVYFVASKFIMAASGGNFSGGLMSLIFAYLFFQGTRASFQLHKHLRETGEVTESVKQRGTGFYAGIFIGSVVLLTLVILVVIGAQSPEIEVIPGKQLNKKYASFLLDNGIIDRSEEIQYWYSDGFMDFEEGFYLFTDKKVVIYSKSWEEPLISVPFSDIKNIEFEPDPSFIEDSRITLTLNDSSVIYFPVASDNGGDKKYYDRLMEIWTSNANSYQFKKQ